MEKIGRMSHRRMQERTRDKLGRSSGKTDKNKGLVEGDTHKIKMSCTYLLYTIVFGTWISNRLFLC